MTGKNWHLQLASLCTYYSHRADQQFLTLL